MATTKSETQVVAEIGADYKYGFHETEDYFFKSGRGLSHELVDAISSHKDEPDWMRKFRHKALEYFNARPLPRWGGNVADIDFENIFYYIKPTEGQADAWEDLPADIKDTWDKLGIPEAEKKYLAGVGAQYESEVVYHKLQKSLEVVERLEAELAHPLGLVLVRRDRLDYLAREPAAGLEEVVLLVVEAVLVVGADLGDDLGLGLLAHADAPSRSGMKAL